MRRDEGCKVFFSSTGKSMNVQLIHLFFFQSEEEEENIVFMPICRPSLLRQDRSMVFGCF